MRPEIQIVDYQDNLRIYFERLNRAWLEKYFTVEAIDIQYFENPEKEILEKGGSIFFAQIKNQTVGTASLIWDGDHLELAKMAVDELAQGQGIGQALAIEGIRRAKAKGERKLMLVTNSKLLPAVSLYQKLGFVETFRGVHPKYQRGDLVMELNL